LIPPSLILAEDTAVSGTVFGEAHDRFPSSPSWVLAEATSGWAAIFGVVPLGCLKSTPLPCRPGSGCCSAPAPSCHRTCHSDTQTVTLEKIAKPGNGFQNNHEIQGKGHFQETLEGRRQRVQF
ncbi:hypothetical protein Nmel_006020, partial [Mimus melanotis]